MILHKWVVRYMKRINEATNQPFSRGDRREDGMVFYKYRNKLQANGFFQEHWLMPDTLARERKAKLTARMGEYTRKSNRLPNGWAKLLHGRSDIAFIRRIYKEMQTKSVTQEQLKKSVWLSETEYELLLPYTSDYEYKS